MNSYENRVYQVGIEEQSPVIVKFYRPARWTDEAILEEHAFSLELAEQEIAVVPPLVIDGKTLHVYESFRFAVFPRQGGRMLELDNLDHLEWMGRFIGRLHAVGAVKPFVHRRRLDVQSYGYEPYQFLLENKFIPEHLLQNYCNTVDAVLNKIEHIIQDVGAVSYLRLHGDCHAGNVLWSDNGPRIVDLDDCLMGPAIQDLWMLTSGDSRHVKEQMDRILDGYEEFYEFDYRELRLIESLRTLRMIHYAGWLAKRWEDPAFPLNFPWFNTPRYWQEQLDHLNEQAELLGLS